MTSRDQILASGAWLAEHGMVALVPVEEAVVSGGAADEALAVRLSAQKLWAEGRANPVSWVCRTWLGDWCTIDRVTWRTTDGRCLAQLQRSPNGRRVVLRVWRSRGFVGHQDDVGWHPASARSRSRQPRPVERALALPLPLAG